MPASMMSDEAGGRVKVKGRSIAIVVIGAMPGSTPTNVPINAPRKQKPRLAGVSATEKPVARLPIRSMRDPRAGRTPSPRPGPQRQTKPADKQRDGEGREADRQHEVLAQAHVRGGESRAQHDRGAREREAVPREEQREQRNR